MLPIWLRYYSKYFSKQDIYVIDNDTTDGSTERLDCKVLQAHHEFAWDDPWMTSTICRVQRELLLRYKYVLYTDIDEFIIPHPDYYQGLTDYIQRFDRKCVQTISYTICHDYKNESDIDLNKPILSQRKLWVFMGDLWGKTCLSKIPIDWECGQHSCKQNEPRNIDNKLYLVHLAMMDINICQKRRLDRINEKIGKLFGKHVLETSNEGIKNHEDSLLQRSYPITKVIQTVEI